MILLKTTVIIVLVIAIGICIEILIHPQVDVMKATYLLKDDVAKVIKALCTKEPVRHVFDETLFCDLKNIVKPYSAVGMDIDIFPYFDGKLHFIYIQIITSEKMELESIENIAELIKIKFRRYLYGKQLNWRNFEYFTTDSNSIKFYLCYEEFVEDRECFERKYQELIREKSGIDCGYIRDDDLEKELNNVN